LTAAALLQLRSGIESTPLPLREVAAFFFGHDPETAARLIVGAELAAAAAIIACGSRVLAIAGAGAVAFVGLACASAALRGSNAGAAVLWPAISLVAGAAAAWCAARIAWTAADLGTSSARRGLSPGWTAIAAIGIASITGRLAASAQFRTPTVDSNPQSGVMAIDLDMKPFVGTPLAESPIGTYLPRVVDQIGNDTAFIVFYNPACDACHTLFSNFFSLPRPERVIAIEIPLAKDAVSAAADYHGPIECPACEFDTLPPGPLWLIAPPMTVKVEQGVVSCVADRFGGDCVSPQG
jgi:hypothetical protein